MSTYHGTLIQSPFKTAIQAVCRLDLRIICGGHKAAAAALALLIRWTEVKIEDFQREYDTYAIPEPDELWLTGNTIARITNWMGGWFDEKTVRAGLSILEDLGYIDRRQDNGVDRTMAYLVNKEVIQERLAAITVEDAAKYVGYEKAAEAFGMSNAHLRAMGIDPTSVPEPKKERKQKEGYVYLVEATGAGRFKIGLTTDFERRMEALQKQSPFPLQCVARRHTSDIHEEELAWHQEFSRFRVHGEWFELDAAAVEEFRSRPEMKVAL